MIKLLATTTLGRADHFHHFNQNPTERLSKITWNASVHLHRDCHFLIREVLLKPLKLTDTIPQDGPGLKGVVQGYARPNNPSGGRDATIHASKFAINPQFEWTGGGYAWIVTLPIVDWQSDEGVAARVGVLAAGNAQYLLWNPQLPILNLNKFY